MFASFFLDISELIMFCCLGVRDYIHVVDLAKGHIAALKKLKEDCGCRVGIRKEGLIFT